MQMLKAFLMILSPHFYCGPELLRLNLD